MIKKSSSVVKPKKANNFWQTLKRPFFVLAPMLDVTDAAFRAMFAKYGKPDVFWTEFVSADGLASRGREKLLPMFQYTEAERPIVAQIFGARPENIKIASALAAELGFDGVDINMGCPDKAVLKQGAGAALINNPKLAREIIRAAHEGIASVGRDIPVSIKTRVGFNKVEIEEWIPELLKENISAITIHARTKKEMSLVPARWDLVKRVVEIVREARPDIVVIGNGDVANLAEARARVKETLCDGVMIGRGAFGQPWLFNEKINTQDLSVSERLDILLEHTKLFEKKLGQHKNFAVMKKHYKAYVNGFPGAVDLRVRLMEAKDYEEVETIVRAFQKSNSDY